MTLFGVKNGLKIVGSENTSDVLNGTGDPSIASGVEALVGSLYLRSNGMSYKKTGAGDTAWQAYSEIDGGVQWSTISGTTTATSNNGYVLDSSSAVFTVTLSATPKKEMRLGLQD